MPGFANRFRVRKPFEILKNHEPVMLDRDTSKRLEEIVRSAPKA